MKFSATSFHKTPHACYLSAACVLDVPISIAIEPLVYWALGMVKLQHFSIAQFRRQGSQCAGVPSAERTRKAAVRPSCPTRFSRRGVLDSSRGLELAQSGAVEYGFVRMGFLGAGDWCRVEPFSTE